MHRLKTIVRFSFRKLSSRTAGRARERQQGLDTIRSAMLEGLPPARQLGLHSRIRSAQTLETLWYVRGELMAWMAVTHGEAQARAHMHGVTSLFDGLLPHGMKARPSPLVH